MQWYTYIDLHSQLNSHRSKYRHTCRAAQTGDCRTQVYANTHTDRSMQARSNLLNISIASGHHDDLVMPASMPKSASLRNFMRL